MQHDKIAPNSFFGRFLVDKGVICDDDLDAALRRQREINKRIGDMAVEKGFLSKGQVREIFEEQKDVDQPFGTIAVRKSLLTRGQLDDLLFTQNIFSSYLGETLLEMGIIGPDEFSGYLREYSDMEYRRRTAITKALKELEHSELIEEAVYALIRGTSRFAGEVLKVEDVGIPLEPRDFPTQYRIIENVKDIGLVNVLVCLSTPMDKLIGSAVIDNYKPETEMELMERCREFFSVIERYYRNALIDAGYDVSDVDVYSEDEEASPKSAKGIHILLASLSGSAGLVFELNPTADRA